MTVTQVTATEVRQASAQKGSYWAGAHVEVSAAVLPWASEPCRC